MADQGAPQQPVDKNPAHQTGEDHGTIRNAQRTEDNMRNKDLPRGSESELGRKSRNRV